MVKDGKPEFAVECKTGEKDIGSSIHYFKERTQIPKFYQVHQGQKDYEKNDIRVLPLITFCKELNMP